MSNQYGVALKWGSAGAPHPATCILESFDYKDAFQTYEENDEAGDLAALILHGRKGAISFGGTITDETVDLPDLSAGAKIDLEADEIVGGIVLCSGITEDWLLGSAKKFSGSATHYPDATGGTGADAGSLNAATPTQVLSPVIRPADKLIWSCAGLTHASGKVHKLSIAQSLELTESLDEEGKIVAIQSHKYMRKISLEILALAAAARPAPDTVLAVTGAPANAANAVITGSDIKWKRGDAAMFSVEAIWFPGIS